LDLKLTGLLDEMMKESMHIALTLAYNLTGEERKKQLREKYDGEYKYGMHILVEMGQSIKVAQVPVSPSPFVYIVC
jgi:ATP-dependent Lon protease